MCWKLGLQFKLHSPQGTYNGEDETEIMREPEEADAAVGRMENFLEWVLSRRKLRVCTGRGGQVPGPSFLVSWPL